MATAGSGTRRWLVAGVAGASLIFAALATLTALVVPPFTSADEAQHVSYALDVGGGSLPLIDTPVHAVFPGMPGIPADCVVTAGQARAGLEAARARLAPPRGPSKPSHPPAATSGPSRPPAGTSGPGGAAGAEPRPATSGPAPAAGSPAAVPVAAGGTAAARPPSAAVEMAAAAMPPCARGARGVRGNTQLTYTANHPPLFYAVESVPLTAGLRAGHPIAGLRAARLLNIAMGVAALAALAWLVRELVPSRPDLAVGTAAVMGTVGMFVNACGQIYNDGLSVATITASLAATVAIIRRGPSWTRLGCFAAVVLAAAATRASGLLAAGILLPAAGAAVALHTHGRWRRLGYAAATVVGGAAVVCAGIGWFYARNNRLYGDPTGSSLIATMFPISEKPMTADEILHSRVFLWAIYRGFYGRPRLLADGRDLTDGPKLVLLLLAVGLGLVLLRRAARASPAAWRAVARRRAGRRDAIRERAGLRGAARRRLPDAVAWAVVALHVAVVVATLVGYVAAGGAWFARYLLPAMPVAALLLAAALAALPGARRGLPTVAAVGALATMAAVMAARELAFKLPRLHPYDTAGRLRSALVLGGVPEPTFTLWTLTVVALAGLLLVAAAMWVLAADAVPAWPLPPGVRAARRGIAVRVAALLPISRTW